MNAPPIDPTCKNYLKLGIAALANCPQHFPGDWFMGHRGAAILACAFLLIDELIDSEATEAVAGEIDRLAHLDRCLIAEQTIFAESSPPATLEPLITQLSRCLQSLSADGHGVIYGALALRAFSLYPELATEAAVNGIATLLENSQTDNPGRYYGIDDYQTIPLGEIHYRHFNNAEEAAIYSLYQHQVVIPDERIDGKLYFFAGDQLHLITHAQALLELDKLGYSELATRGLDSLRKHFYLLEKRMPPTDAKPYQAQTSCNPRKLEFWQRNKQDEHHCKLGYSVLSLLNLAAPEDEAEILAAASKYWQLFD